jgi:predicted kinase
MDSLTLNLWDEARREKIEPLQWQLGQQLLALGLIVIIEWGTWGRSERELLRIRARELEIPVELHYLYPPVAVLLDRIQRRDMENPVITREQLLHWADPFEALTAEESALFDNAFRPGTLTYLRATSREQKKPSINTRNHRTLRCMAA